MTAPRSISPSLSGQPNTQASPQVLVHCEAIVLETHEGRCTRLAVNGETVVVPPGKAGRYLVRVDDVVMAALMDDGTARIAYVVSEGDNEFIPQIRTLGDLARLVLPEHITQLLAEVGDSKLEINQAGVDLKGRKVNVASDTQLNLKGRSLNAEADDLCTLQGREIHLN